MPRSLLAPALSLGLALAHCARDPDPVDPLLAAAARRRAERLDPRRVPETLGADHAVALTSAPDGSRVVASAREDAPDRPSPTYALAAFPVVHAALHAGLIGTPFVCTGTRCPRAHGPVTAASTIALPCLDHLAALAPRLGTGVLGAAFRAFALDPPPFPESPLARQSLLLGDGSWRVTPLDLVPFAARLALPTGPSAAPLDEALVLPVDPALAGPLRGITTGRDDEAWFVGFAHTPVDRLVVVRASGCPSGCVNSAVRIARWALDGSLVPLHPLPAAPLRGRSRGGPAVVR